MASLYSGAFGFDPRKITVRLWGCCTSERKETALRRGNSAETVSLRDAEVKKKLSSDIGPDACIGAGCKMAQTLPIFALAKGPLGITLVVAQLAINRHCSAPLANIYLHYAFDLWVNMWRKKWAHGELVVIRYADDIILGFQHQADADRFLENLQERLGIVWTGVASR